MESSGFDEDYNTTIQFNYEDLIGCTMLNVWDFGVRVLTPLYSLVFIIGVLGNLLVILVLIQYKRPRSMTSIYLFNLAISDLVFLFTLPFWIDYKMKAQWVFGDAMCKLFNGFYYVGFYSEIFFIIVLTIDRYLAIVHAVVSMRIRTVTSGIITSIIIWALAFLVSFPTFYFFKSKLEFSHYSCTTDLYGESLKKFIWSQVLSMNILGLILPLLVMIICYRRIIQVLHRRPSEKKVKAVHLIFVITILFFLLWTPFNLTIFVSASQDVLFTSTCAMNQQMDLALMVTEMIAYTHCCANPVIYVFMGERFRKYLQQLFQRHVVVPLAQWLPCLSVYQQERSGSMSPSTGDHEPSTGF
ncbi:C-C chemokine receptor type 1-like [Nannospalax galili]|uniref:C-C chemokine receptor type 1-like n=1 Tax=Nannospalax galili TaxID=1026970 RepID=UPI0004ED28B1|nr:C-C chemokine receptor type 1-like [Nannospalax galili]